MASGITFGHWSTDVEAKIQSQFGAGITALADFWTPHFVFHPSEIYFPLNFNAYIAECSIRFVDSGLLVCPNGDSAQTGIVCPAGDTLSSVYLGEFAAGISAGFTLGGSADAVWSNLTLAVNNGNANSIVLGFGGTMLAQAPIYTLAYTDVGETMLYITYTHMYGFNGPYHILFVPFDAHFSDIEHVALEFELDGLRLTRMYFAAHGRQEGVWVDAQDVEYTIDGTPVVYVSLNSHASQQRAGVYFRSLTLGLTNDLTDASGSTWDPEIAFIPNFVPVGDTTYGWLFFQGTVGNGSVANLPQQDWTSWIAGDQTGWNGFYTNPTWSATLQFIFWFTLIGLIILAVWVLYVLIRGLIRLIKRQRERARQNQRLEYQYQHRLRPLSQAPTQTQNQTQLQQQQQQPPFRQTQPVAAPIGSRG